MIYNNHPEVVKIILTDILTKRLEHYVMQHKISEHQHQDLLGHVLLLYLRIFELIQLNTFQFQYQDKNGQLHPLSLDAFNPGLFEFYKDTMSLYLTAIVSKNKTLISRGVVYIHKDTNIRLNKLYWPRHWDARRHIHRAWNLYLFLVENAAHLAYLDSLNKLTLIHGWRFEAKKSNI